jgi:hypothetical protein
MLQIQSATLSERIAHHEAGHCCACLAFSIPIKRIEINTGTPHLLRGNYRGPAGSALQSILASLSSDAPISLALESIVTMSGIAPILLGLAHHRCRLSGLVPSKECCLV